MDGGITSFDLAVQQARERLHRADHLERRRVTLNDQCKALRTEIAELERVLAKENRDVERLRRTSLSSIVASIRGDKEDRLSREQAEAEAANVRLEGHRNRLAEQKRALQATLTELGELRGAAEDYQGALDAKEAAVHDGGGALSAELTQMASEYGDLVAARREHEEAAAAGVEAEQAAAAMLRRLDDASGTSTFDVVGGGLLTDMVERGQLEEAERLGWQVQQHLDRFAAELRDIGIVVDPKVPTVDTGAFMDTFFDNVFTDLAKHDRINQSKRGVEQLLHWLRATIGRVRAEQHRLAGRCEELRLRRERLLTQ